MKLIFQKLIRLLVIMSLALIFYAIFCLLVPPQFDDLCFEAIYTDYGGGSSFNMSAWLNFASTVRANDVGRLSNLFVPIATLIYPWRLLYPWVTGLVCAATVLLSVKLAFSRAVGWRSYLLMWITLAIALPMRNNIMVPAYTLNYIYAAAVNLSLIVIMLYINDHKSYLVTLLCVILSVLAGGWHEGFSLPLIAGLVAVSVIERHRNVSWWIILIVYMVSTICFVIDSGTTARASGELGLNLHSIIMSSIDTFMVPVTVLLLIILWIRDKKYRVLNPVFIIFFTAALVAFALSFVVNHNSRVSFAPQLYAAIAFWTLFNKSSWGNKILCNRAVISIGAILLGCVAMTSLVWQYRFYKEHQLIMSEFESTRASTIYHDIIMPETVPLYTMLWPVRCTWVEPFQYKCFAMKYGVNLAVVPTALDCDISQHCINIDGNAGVKSVDGVLVGPLDLMTNEDMLPELREMVFSYPDGSVHTHLCLLMPFTDNSGINRVYIKPYHRLLLSKPQSQPMSICVY